MTEMQFNVGKPPEPNHHSRFLPSDHNAKESEIQPGVLIVEDELLVAENIRELLNAAGYNVVAICTSGEEAIEIFEQMNPDLVLMDIRLAGHLDGIQTAAVIHQTFKQVPILFLTAYGEELIPEIGSVGVCDLLTKPYDKTQVIQSIARLLTKSGRSFD